MIQAGGFFIWPEDLIYDGIRQDASESVRRYRALENLHWGIRGALTKDLGTRLLTTTAVQSGNYSTTNGFDAHFGNGTQVVVITNKDSSNQKVYTYNTSTDVFDEVANALHATNRPCIFMFADMLTVVDGSAIRTMNSGKTWYLPLTDSAGTPSGSTAPLGASYVNVARFGGVYANRAIVAGNPTYPQTFFPSDVLNPKRWDVTQSVDVTGTFGQEITAMGNCGNKWIVFTRNMCRAYFLGTAGPKDWDFDDISNLSGAITWESLVQPSGIKGVNTSSFLFFWADEGPMMIADRGSGVPVLIPLWSSIQQAVEGTAWQDVIALDVSKFDMVVGEWCRKRREVRFACTELTSAGEAQNNVVFCLDFDSALRYASSGANPDLYPYWRIRNNKNRGWVPSYSLFNVRVDSTGQPNPSGQMQQFGVRDGYVYEYDAPETFTDADPTDEVVNFAWKIRKDGYDGFNDGVREYDKSLRHIQMRTTGVGGTISATAYADGGAVTRRTEIEPAAGMSRWGTEAEQGSWGDGGNWNAGEFKSVKGELGPKGKKFDLELSDNGTIVENFSINSWSLMGYVEDEI